nr:amino acid permease [Entomoplasma sp. MP1]
MDQEEGILSNPEVNKDFTKLYLTIILIPAATLTGFIFWTETATYITEEIENPKKTVPKTVVGGVIIVMLVYIIYTIALLSIAKTGELIGNGKKQL